MRRVPEYDEASIKKQMKRIGNVLDRISLVAICLFFALAALMGIGALLIAFRVVEPSRMRLLYDHNPVYSLLTTFWEETDSHLYAVVGCMVSCLSFLGMAFLTRRFRCLLREMISQGRPFTHEAAARIRRTAFVMLIGVFYNPLFGLGLFGVFSLLSRMVDYGAYLQEQADMTHAIQEEMILSFAEITENKSGQTGQHIRRVSEYARIIAEKLGADAEKIRLASTMHDIGKLMIPEAILEKPGRLTDEEYAAMKRHTTYGGQLLENVEGDVMRVARTVALEHHERVDGRGYPEGKKEISLEGRIVAVADVFDALTSRRSYKEAWSADSAYEEIARNSGTQFDADVVRAFMESRDEIERIRVAYQDE